jgi:hypothetical protein
MAILNTIIRSAKIISDKVCWHIEISPHVATPQLFMQIIFQVSVVNRALIVQCLATRGAIAEFHTNLWFACDVEYSR